MQDLKSLNNRRRFLQTLEVGAVAMRYFELGVVLADFVPVARPRFGELLARFDVIFGIMPPDNTH